MKKSLLLIASLFMTLASFAQSWTKPAITAADYSEMKVSTLAGEGAGDSIVYYLYNIEGEGFLNGGKAPSHSQWATNGILADKGIKIMISKYELKEVAGESESEKYNVASSEPAEWDGKTYVINDYWNNKWMQVILTNANGCFVDRSKQIDYKFEIIPQEGNIYYIKTADVNPYFSNEELAKLGVDGNGLTSAESYFGFNGEDLDYKGQDEPIKPITPALDITRNDVDDPVEPHYKWAFISEKAYDIYSAKMDLYNALNKAVEEGVDYASASSVYTSSNDIEAIKAATKELNAAIRLHTVYAVLEGATESNPKDATSLLVNNNFETGNIDGWICTFEKGKNATNIGYQGRAEGYTNGEVSINKFIEAWAAVNTNFNPNIDFRAVGDGKLYQKLESLPAGKYKLSVDCVAVQQDKKVETVTGVQLFATGGTIDNYQEISTGDGLPEHFDVEFLSAGGDMELGLRTVNCTANWIAADNFMLEYYGPVEDDPLKMKLDNIIKAATDTYDPEEMDNIYANGDVKKAYQFAIEAAKAASTDYELYGERVNVALASLKQSVAAYNKLERFYDEMNEAMGSDNWESYNNEEYDEVETFLITEEENSARYILDNGTIADDEVEPLIDRIRGILRTSAIKAAEAYKGGEGLVVTSLLINPDFESGDLTGWTFNKANANGLGNSDDAGAREAANETYATEGTSGKYLFNTWAWGNPITQTIEGVPNGVYQLEVLVASSDDCKAIYILGNDTRKQVMLTGSQKEGTEGSMNIIVTNNKLTVGLVGPDANGISYLEGGRWWYKADNFRLTYLGNDPDACSVAIDDKLEELDNFGSFVETIDDVEYANADYLGSDVVNLIDTYTKQAETLKKDADATAVNKFMADVDATIALGSKSVSVFKNIDNLMVDFANAIDESENTEVISQANDYNNKISEDIASRNLTVAEAEAATKEIRKLMSLLALPSGYDKATDDNGVDFTSVIINADLDGLTVAGDKLGAWSWTKGGGNGPVYPYGAAAGASTGAEFWNDPAEKLSFSLTQVLSNLPAGKYELTVKAGNSLNGVESNGETGRAALYAKVGNTYSSTPIEVVTGDAVADAKVHSVIFTVPENTEEVTVGVQSVGKMEARWFFCDYFTLTYYGNDSKKADTEDDGSVVIKDVQSIDAPVAIYTTSGARMSAMKKGINIVRMSDGTVRKVLVK